MTRIDTASPKRRLFTRRRVLKTIGGGFVAGSAALTWAVGVEPHWFEVVEQTLPMLGLPPSLAGKRLVQLSDLHVGAVDLDYLISACRQVNDLQPDLVVFTGDFINHDYAGDATDLLRVLSSLAPTSLGTFACMGNHDYGRGYRNHATASRVAATLHSAGIRLLREQAVDIGGLSIVGLDDLWSRRFEGTRVLATVDPNSDAICLVHNPDACDLPVWSNFRGRILSGHTHGGQCRPPFLPPPFIPVDNRAYVAGHYALDERRSLYINRGIGHTKRARFNCRPEITLFTLAAA